MAHPTRKHTQSRKGKRRAHWTFQLPTATPCAQCGQQNRPHRACVHCGYYRGRQVIVVKEKTKKKARPS